MDFKLNVVAYSISTVYYPVTYRETNYFSYIPIAYKFKFNYFKIITKFKVKREEIT